MHLSNLIVRPKHLFDDVYLILCNYLPHPLHNECLVHGYHVVIMHLLNSMQWRSRGGGLRGLEHLLTQMHLLKQYVLISSGELTL